MTSPVVGVETHLDGRTVLLCHLDLVRRRIHVVSLNPFDCAAAGDVQGRSNDAIRLGLGEGCLPLAVVASSERKPGSDAAESRHGGPTAINPRLTYNPFLAAR